MNLKCVRGTRSHKCVVGRVQRVGKAMPIKESNLLPDVAPEYELSQTRGSRQRLDNIFVMLTRAGRRYTILRER